jgi:ArsR family transcriptional regulator
MAKSLPLIQEICCAPLSEAPLAEAEATDLARILKALADPVRLRLVSVIAAAGEGCACDFPALLGKSQPTISHHLSQLVDAGIITREQRGKWAWFKVNDDRLGDIRSALG